MTEAYDRSRYLRDSLIVRHNSLLVRSSLVPLGYIVIEGIEMDGIRGAIAFSGPDASVKLGGIERTGVRNREGVIQWEMFDLLPGSAGTPFFQNEISDPMPIKIQEATDQMELGLIK